MQSNLQNTVFPFRNLNLPTEICQFLPMEKIYDFLHVTMFTVMKLDFLNNVTYMKVGVTLDVTVLHQKYLNPVCHKFVYPSANDVSSN